MRKTLCDRGTLPPSSCESQRGASNCTSFAYLHRNEVQDLEVQKCLGAFWKPALCCYRQLAVRDISAGDKSPVWAADWKSSAVFLASRNFIATAAHGSCWSSFSVSEGNCSASLQGAALRELQLEFLIMSLFPGDIQKQALWLLQLWTKNFSHLKNCLRRNLSAVQL